MGTDCGPDSGDPLPLLDGICPPIPDSDLSVKSVNRERRIKKERKGGIEYEREEGEKENRTKWKRRRDRKEKRDSCKSVEIG